MMVSVALIVISAAMASIEKDFRVDLDCLRVCQEMTKWLYERRQSQVKALIKPLRQRWRSGNPSYDVVVLAEPLSSGHID